MYEQILRQQLKILIEKGKTHLKVQDIINDFAIGHINSRVPNIPYPVWELLEHMRIAQQDILNID